MYTLKGRWDDGPCAGQAEDFEERFRSEGPAIKFACDCCYDWDRVEVYRDGVLIGHASIARSTDKPIWLSKID
jgi:hypothetical protein